MEIAYKRSIYGIPGTKQAARAERISRACLQSDESVCLCLRVSTGARRALILRLRNLVRACRSNLRTPRPCFAEGGGVAGTERSSIVVLQPSDYQILLRM